MNKTAEMEQFKFIHYETIDSTNEEAKRRFAAGEREPMLIWADAQTKGKGRNGRSFYSPKDTGIYFSYLYADLEKKSIDHLIFVTTAAAVFVADALNRFTDANAKIKWVNDVYVEEKKVCGILAEAAFAEDATGIVVGIGINLTTKDFPDDIKTIASGIGTFEESELNRIKEKILQSVGERFAEFFECCENKDYRRGILEEYRLISLVIGREVQFQEAGKEMQSAVAEEIEEDGSLLVRLPDGERKKLSSGEIHLKLC